MLELLINNEPLELYEDTSFTVQYRNSVFNLNGIEGENSTSFRIPGRNSVKNRKIFDNPHRINKANKEYKEYVVEHKFAGLRQNLCTLVVTEAGDDYECL